ncbi:MAG: hypothetical protein AB8G22_02330 [Saprospiraceae bacterium]
MKDKTPRFRSTDKRFKWIFSILLLLTCVPIVYFSENVKAGLMYVLLIAVPMLGLPAVVYSEYVIEGGQLKKYTLGTNQSGLDRALIISNLTLVALIKKDGEVVGMKLYDSDQIIPQMTVRVERAGEFLNLLKRENPQLRVK